jgi:hypothetical protein
MTSGANRFESKPGDVFEMDVDDAKAYVQLINYHDEYGQLVRVLPGVHEDGDVESLVGEDDAFLVFFPVDAALKQGILRQVGRYDIPRSRRSFPTFKAPGGITESGKVLNWWIWDGETERRVDTLNDEQRDLPVAEIINDTLLRERIKAGWRPRDEAG